MIHANQTVKLTSDGSVDKDWVVSVVFKQCESIQINSSKPTYYVDIPGIGKNVQVAGRAIGYGIINSRQ